MVLLTLEYSLEVSVRIKEEDPTTKKPKLKVVQKSVEKVYPNLHKVAMNFGEKREQVH